MYPEHTGAQADATRQRRFERSVEPFTISRQNLAQYDIKLVIGYTKHNAEYHYNARKKVLDV